MHQLRRRNKREIASNQHSSLEPSRASSPINSNDEGCSNDISVGDSGEGGHINTSYEEDSRSDSSAPLHSVICQRAELVDTGMQTSGDWEHILRSRNKTTHSGSIHQQDLIQPALVPSNIAETVQSEYIEMSEITSKTQNEQHGHCNEAYEPDKMTGHDDLVRTMHTAQDKHGRSTCLTKDETIHETKFDGVDPNSPITITKKLSNITKTRTVTFDNCQLLNEHSQEYTNGRDLQVDSVSLNKVPTTPVVQRRPGHQHHSSAEKRWHRIRVMKLQKQVWAGSLESLYICVYICVFICIYICIVDSSF